MKTSPMTLWTIIDRLQRRLERAGMAPAAVDAAVAMAIRSMVVSPR